MPTLEQLSRTLEKIYAAAADPKQWEEALLAIEDFTGSTGAVLDLVPKEIGPLPHTFAGSFSNEECAEYALNYQSVCPRIAFAVLHPDIPIHYDHMILSEAEMDRNPVYDWFGKHGLRYYLAGMVGHTSSYQAYFSLQRSRRQGHVRPDDLNHFALLQRHMTQSLALASRIGTLENQCRLGLTLLQSLPYAAFALDADGLILFMNRRAEEIIQAGDGLRICDGRLASSTEELRLERLIRSADERAPDRAHGGWVRVHRQSGKRPYIVLVSALTVEGAQFDDFQARMLAIICNPDDHAVPDEQALHDLFELSISEARVAISLAQGHSIESAAACLRISVETVRSHLKNAFRKLGVNRQQDLVRQLVAIGLVGGRSPAVPGSADTF